MYTLAVIGALLLAGPEAADDLTLSGAQPAPSARVWVEEDLDLFYPGDAVNLRFRTSEDAYVAVLHVDTEGRLDLVYPTSRWDDELVRGMRTYTLPLGARTSSFRTSRTPGIGYFYIIASRYPLDLGFFFNPRMAQYDLFGHGRTVRGDPFWVLDQLAHLLAGDGVYGRFASDIYSYHVGGVHRYPTFACYDRFSRSQQLGSYPYYTDCFELQRLLARHPHYYDTRRYRGDRRGFIRELDRLAPLHGFKERPDLPARPGMFPEPAASEMRGRGIMPVPPGRTDRAEPPTTPARQRPTLERRPEPRQEDPRAAEPRAPTRATPTRETPARETPAGETPARSTPSRESSGAQPSRGSGTTATPRATPAREQPRAQPSGGSSTPTRAAPQRSEPSATPARSGGSAPTRAVPAGRARSG